VCFARDHGPKPNQMKSGCNAKNASVGHMRTVPGRTVLTTSATNATTIQRMFTHPVGLSERAY
jgi:hypothetical protein